MKTASSGGTGRGWAPGMGSEMTRFDLEVCSGLVPPRAAEPICCARSMALSGSLLGSEQACCHTGIFWVKRSLPWVEDEEETYQHCCSVMRKLAQLSFSFVPFNSLLLFSRLKMPLSDTLASKDRSSLRSHHHS